MIFGRLLFWIIVFYVLYKFVVNLVIPVLQAIFKVQSAMKNMTPTQNSNSHSAQFSTEKKKETVPKRDDYIDFEEIK